MATYYSVVRQLRWRIFLPALFVSVALLLYANGDMHGWLMAWYLLDWVVILVVLRLVHRPEQVERHVQKLWERTPPVEAGTDRIGQELRRLSRDPRLCWMSLELDPGGDLLVATNVAGRSVRHRFRTAEECPHCVLESMLREFVAVDPVDEIEFYRTETSAGMGCAAYVYFDQRAGVRMDITHDGRNSPLAAAGCTIHAR
ncbi:hypothetical protein ACQEVG_32170 [Streptomyces sp. CA-135486]|uniref:hypothetical protein n=1 Tax=Streptomyces sp. CA-135486 TaxID=3240049 RepID=UPI003D8B0352